MSADLRTLVLLGGMFVGGTIADYDAAVLYAGPQGQRHAVVTEQQREDQERLTYRARVSGALALSCFTVLLAGRWREKMYALDERKSMAMFQHNAAHGIYTVMPSGEIVPPSQSMPALEEMYR